MIITEAKYMIVRLGFVSNSSSSSFVVFVPKSFKPDWDKYKDMIEDRELTNDGCQEAYDELLKKGDLWDEENHASAILKQMFRDAGLIVAAVDTSSDMGQITIIDRDRIVKLLEGEK